jgi:hypothetical protein
VVMGVRVGSFEVGSLEAGAGLLRESPGRVRRL